MYLKRMELQGFKSFSSKTKIDLEPGISCIVGPNGSGKSNIADALRWVLGEQNARSIRGGKLEDVIFSGTEKRRPLSMAEVTIILDNGDGHLDLPTSEVSVTRRAIRGGGSEYLINDKSCRLKDIHDLFVDTGVSVDGLSIINQGRVNELINARPDERRVLVEEAAGIIKYRDRKREAVRRLSETERHLETIGAVISELSERIEPLSQQAEKARKYLDLKNEADNLEIGISVKVLTESKDKIDSLDSKLEDNRRLLLETESNRLNISAEAEKLRLSINELDETVKEASRDFYEMQTAREKAEGELALNRSEKDNNDAELARLDKELYALEQEINGKKLEIEALSQHISRTEQEIAEQEQDILSGQGGEDDIRAKAALINENLEQLRRKLNDAVADKTALSGQLDFKEQLIAKDNAELTDCGESLDRLSDETDTDTGKIEELRNRKQKLQEAVKKHSATVNEQQDILRSLNKKLEDAAVEEADLRYKVSSARTRVAMLEEMAAAYEGFFPGVKGLMTAKRKGDAPDGIIGVISELMDVPEKYRVAIETYMGANLQNVVTSNADTAKAAVTYLKKHELGRATFLPLDILKVRPAADISAAASVPGVKGLASTLVDCDGKVRKAVDFLLNNVVIADNMDSAANAAKALKYRNSIVTLDGDVVNPGASISGGSRNKKSPDLLGKKSKLQAAKKELEQTETELAKFQQANSGIRDELNRCSDAAEAARSALQEASRESVGVEQELSRLSFEEEHRVKQQELLLKQQENLRQNIASLEDDLASLRDEYAAAVSAAEEIEKKASQFNDELEELQEKISGQQDQLTQRKVKLASSRQKLHGQQISLERLNEELTNLSWEAEEKDADRKEVGKKGQELTEIISQREQSLLKMVSTLHGSGQNLESLRQGLSEYGIQLTTLEKQEKELTRQRENYQNEVHQLELRRERWLADFDNEAAKLVERFQLELEQARALVGDLGSRTAMGTRLNQLRREINALGDVNVSAIDEYAEVSQRYGFLTDQRQDMLSARAKLDTVIAEMDRIMSGRFKDAYAQLSAAFDKSFNRLFGGGGASLILSQPDDILETGVEIQVSPPGKKVTNYNLLSGGEKSLVGIALMFAMLAVRPTPFCVMDEVDAALDEANIGRFTGYLREKAANGQFVMITHRQSTMEAASALWGVTMEEEGVSSILSVKLDQVS